MKFSRLTLAFGAYIVISASFMQQFRAYLISLFGRNFTFIALFAAFALISLSLFYLAFRRKSKLLRAAALSALIFLAFILIRSQPYFSEKSHVLTYGLLGFLASRDLSRVEGRVTPVSVIIFVMFVAAVGVLDEAFQHLLPYRVGELRDVVTNALSGFIGGASYIAIRREI